MTQLDLFADDRYEPPSLARQSDPPTSQQAAADIAQRLGEMQVQMLAVFIDGTYTAVEAATICSQHGQGRMESYRKRTKELERMGHVECVGVRECEITGKRARVFRAIDLLVDK